MWLSSETGYGFVGSFELGVSFLNFINVVDVDTLFRWHCVYVCRDVYRIVFWGERGGGGGGGDPSVPLSLYTSLGTV